MATIVQNVNSIRDSLIAIKEAANEKGAGINYGDDLNTWAEKIASIEGGTKPWDEMPYGEFANGLKQNPTYGSTYRAWGGIYSTYNYMNGISAAYNQDTQTLTYTGYSGALYYIMVPIPPRVRISSCDSDYTFYNNRSELFTARNWTDTTSGGMQTIPEASKYELLFAYLPDDYQYMYINCGNKRTCNIVLAAPI